MDDISNRTLAILLVTAIVVSLGATVHVLNTIRPGAVGRATSDTESGNVTLTVDTDVAIMLNPSTVDFGTGIVNTSVVGCTESATLNAGSTYNDTEGTNCWTASEAPESLVIENIGNKNITLTVDGPTERSFFTPLGGVPYALGNPYNLTFRARDNETGACNEWAAGATGYRTFGGTTRTICSNMDFEPSSADTLAIDIKVVIPADVEPGVYENASVVFTAGAAT